MDDNSALTIVIIMLIVTMGGCTIIRDHSESKVQIERYKTQQMKYTLQAKIDSTQLANQLIKLKLR